MKETQAVDLILKYISRPENSSKHFTSEELQETLFPDETLEIVEHYIVIIENQIRNYSPKIAKYSEYYLSATGYTKRFVEDGGFFKMEQDQQENDFKKEEEKRLGLEKLNLEVVKLRNDFFDYQETKKRAKQSLIVSKVSVAIACAAVLITMLKWKCG